MRTLVSHLLLPQQTNNQRPKVLHPQAVMFYVVVFFVLQLGFRIGKFIYPQILGYATNITVEDLLSLTNQKRQENGLFALSLDPTLSLAAQQKGQDMFSKNYWAHISPDGVTPWQFIERSGYSYLFAGENLAKDFTDPSGVVAAWMASPTHRDNILKSEYQDIGLAVVNGNLNGVETTLVIQMFGQRKTELAAKTPLISAKAAVAKTPPSSPISKEPTVAPIPFISPTPVVAKISGVHLSSSLKTFPSKKPMIDILTLERGLSLALLTVLLSVLVVDGLFVLKRKTVRVVGYNIAHIIFLATLVGLIFLTKRGVIL